MTGRRFAAIEPVMAMDIEFSTMLAAAAERLEGVLESILSDRGGQGEITRPVRLLAAMRHGSLGGGKRLRPFLLVETAAFCGDDSPAVWRVAAALECVHCYSLIHDDLPSMDDDDLRRGQPAVHKAYDEATAILAGDALLTLAFDVIASPETDLPDERKSGLVSMLSRAAGVGGMVGGQMLDLQASGKPPEEAGIIQLQAMKTGALIRCACEAGAVAAGAASDRRRRLAEFGSAIGLAFQLADDLLDKTGSAANLGKATRKDLDAGKATLVGLHGQEWAGKQLDGLVDQAVELLAPYGSEAAILIEAARFIAARTS